MSKTRIGVIGVGGIGQNHINHLLKVPQAEIAAICDVNKLKLDEVGDRFGIADRYEDVGKLLKNADVEAVVVATPNVFHTKLSTAALRAGKHVLCEKPLALSGRDMQKVLDTAAKANRIFMGAMSWRFFPASQALKRYVDKGETGQIYYARASLLRRRGIPGLGGWFTNKKLAGGGALFDIGVHMLDLAMWVMGSPNPVGISAAAYQKFEGRATDGGWPPMQSRTGDKFDGTNDVDDFAVGFVRFDNGATLVLEACWSSNNEPSAGLRFFGELAGAKMNHQELTMYAEDDCGTLLDISPQLAGEGNYTAEARHFVDCVSKGKKPLTKPQEMLNVTRVLEAFYKSSERGKEVVLQKSGRK